MVLPVICSPFERRPLKRRAFLSNQQVLGLKTLVFVVQARLFCRALLSYCSSLLNLLSEGGDEWEGRSSLNFCLRRSSQDIWLIRDAGLYLWNERLDKIIGSVSPAHLRETVHYFQVAMAANAILSGSRNKSVCGSVGPALKTCWDSGLWPLSPSPVYCI